MSVKVKELVMVINSADLFCGGGGASTGMDKACRNLGFRRMGVALNHWSKAVSTMRANHPNIETLNCNIEEAIPADLIHGKVHLVWASPTCVHFSRARGGKPRSNQLRSQPEHVLTWLTQCDVDNLIVENVPEFMEWGPLYGEDMGDKAGKPIPEKKGVYFRAWIDHIKSLGYNLKYDVLCCADYGDATTRRRFFMLASKVGLPEPEFPKPKFGNHKKGLKQWRSARECLDLSDTGRSIFNREKPLSKNTLRRIAVGMAKYNGMDFLMDMLGAGESDSCRLRQLELPLPTQHAGGNRFALVKPFIVKLRNNCTVDDVDAPLSTLTTSGAHHALCTPLIIGQQSGSAARPVDDPCPTIATGGVIRVVTPILLDMSRPGGKDSGHVRSADDPMCTITTCDAMQVALPMMEDGRLIDIRIRMLKPSELAAVHSFPKDYVFTGNRGEQVKQIGNSVPVNTAAALCEQMLKKYFQERQKRKELK